MDLSIVIVNYNVKSFLRQALRTIVDASRGLETEIFVVDNGSSDGSAEMVSELYPGVQLIQNRQNVGFARANNQALRRCQGRYILLINPDTIVRQDTLVTMVRFLDEHPEAGAAGCKILNPDGTLQLACRRGFPTPGAAFFKITGLSRLFPKSSRFARYNLTYLDPDQVHEVDALSGSFMVVRREALDGVGLLDETFFMYGEDLDLCYRIKEAGWKIFYVPETEIIHFKGESTKRIPRLKSLIAFYGAMHIFVGKHLSKRYRLLTRWLLTAAILLRGLFSLIGRVAGRLLMPMVNFILVNLAGTRMNSGIGRKRTLIVGIGEEASCFLQMVHRFPSFNHEIIGLIGTSADPRGEMVNGIMVIGTIEDLPALVKEHRIDSIVITTQAAPYSQILRVNSGLRRDIQFELIPASFVTMVDRGEIREAADIPLIRIAPPSRWRLGG
ncbi:MAG TPA: glycosyltransferase [Candidatus Latescibacteria bacterium]|nr:glycosyltransferase [Candidatus Latescibacterota bacterium]